MENIKRYETCPVCGKRILFEYNMSIINNPPPFHTCSEECSNILLKHGAKVIPLSGVRIS